MAGGRPPLDPQAELELPDWHSPLESQQPLQSVHPSATGVHDGATANTHVQGKCRLEIDLTGEMPGRIMKAAVKGVFED